MEENKVYRDHNFQIVSGSALSSMMGVALIVPSFTKIAGAFGVTEQSVGLLITMSTLPCFILTPVSGIIADRLGRKRVLVISIILFGLFGAGCAFAPDFKTLIILRILQGIASAPLGGLPIAMIGDLFNGQKRAEAMGINTTVMYAGYVVYPLLGGGLASLDWRYAFLPFALAIPLGIIALTCLHCPEPKIEQSLKDYLGKALHYLKSMKVLWLFSALIITYILLYGAYLTGFSLFLANKFQASPTIIGLFISVVGLVTAISSSQAGRLNGRFSAVSLIIFAFIIYALALAIIPELSGIWLCLLPAILFGIAHGLNLPSQTVTAVGVAPIEYRAGFMAINGTMMFLGMTIGPLITGLAISLTDINISFLITAVIALIIPVMAFIIGRVKISKP